MLLYPEPWKSRHSSRIPKLEPNLERNVGAIVEEHGFSRAWNTWKDAALEAAVGDAVPNGKPKPRGRRHCVCVRCRDAPRIPAAGGCSPSGLAIKQETSTTREPGTRRSTSGCSFTLHQHGVAATFLPFGLRVARSLPFAGLLLANCRFSGHLDSTVPLLLRDKFHLVLDAQFKFLQAHLFHLFVFG